MAEERERQEDALHSAADTYRLFLKATHSLGIENHFLNVQSLVNDLKATDTSIYSVSGREMNTHVTSSQCTGRREDVFFGHTDPAPLSQPLKAGLRAGQTRCTAAPPARERLFT